MKKIISLMVLLLMVIIATVSARTVEKEFETKIDVTLMHNSTYSKYDIEFESGDCSDYIESESSKERTKECTIKIKRDVQIEDIGGLENITKVMEELVDVSLQLAKYGNDSKTYQEKYNEKNAAHARVVINYDNCKQQRDEYKNDSIQLTTCKTDLTTVRMAKNQCNSDLAVCAKDLEEQEASTQTAWIIGILIGAGGLYLITNVKKWMPAEKDSFQH